MQFAPMAEWIFYEAAPDADAASSFTWASNAPEQQDKAANAPIVNNCLEGPRELPKHTGQAEDKFTQVTRKAGVS